MTPPSRSISHKGKVIKMAERANRFISILYRYAQRYFVRKLRPLGIDPGQLPAFMEACVKPGITQEGITINTGVDKGTTARSVIQLEKLGLVQRVTDVKDRRINHVYPTPAGLELFPAVVDVFDDLHGVMYQDFTLEEIQQTALFLHRMKQNLGDYFNSEASKAAFSPDELKKIIK